jgi:aryl sulfotransferase
MTERIESPATAAGASEDGAESRVDPREQGAPWVNPEILQSVRWRDGDVVVSVPVKSGTTWTMNIVHQLRTGGDPDFDDVYLEVPWLELLTGPTVTSGDVLRMVDSMPEHRRRAFKTHAAPELLPYLAPGRGASVRYVVVIRNPDEVLASFFPFARSHSTEWLALWGIEKQEFMPSDIRTFFDSFGKSMLPEALFGFVAAWWALRHEPNVLLMHFSDMTRDHEGSVRKIADFLGFAPTAEQWPAILEYTSFSWMKTHERKFELRHVTEVPVLDAGAMLRRGRTGAAHEDGVTPEMSAELKTLGKDVLTDERALEWLYAGGAMP